MDQDGPRYNAIILLRLNRGNVSTMIIIKLGPLLPPWRLCMSVTLLITVKYQLPGFVIA